MFAAQGKVVGGFVGRNHGSGTIENSYSIGFVVPGGPSYINDFEQRKLDFKLLAFALAIDKSGGFVGENAGTLIGNTYDAKYSGQSCGIGGSSFPCTEPAGLVGKNSNEMYELSTFKGMGWDISTDVSDASTWHIISGVSYPFLDWQFNIEPRVIKGTAFDGQGILATGGGNAVKYALNGRHLTTAHTGAAGQHYTHVDQNNFTRSNRLIAYTTDVSSRGMTLLIPNNTHIDNLDIYKDFVIARSRLDNTPVINSDFATALGTINDPELLFAASPDEVNTQGKHFMTWGANGEVTAYEADGNLVTGGGNVFFNGSLTLLKNSIIDVGSGDITFLGMIDGAYDLTVQTSGNLNILSDIGSTTALRSFETQSGGMTSLSANIFTSGGGITFNNPVNVTQDSVLSAQSADGISFNQAISGNNAGLELNTTGNLTFLSTVILDSLTVSNVNNLILLGTMSLNSYTQTQGSGLSNFGLNSLVVDGNITITADNITGHIVGNDVTLNGINGNTADVEASRLFVNGLNGGTLTGIINGDATQDAALLVSLLMGAQGSFLFNGCKVGIGCIPGDPRTGGGGSGSGGGINDIIDPNAGTNGTDAVQGYNPSANQVDSEQATGYRLYHPKDESDSSCASIVLPSN